MWFQNWGHFEMDFVFINWISKSFRNGSSTLYSYFQTIITSLFQLWFADYLKFGLLTSWALKWYIECPKITSGSALNITFNSYNMFWLHFEFQISIWAWLHLLQTSFIMVARPLSHFITYVAGTSCLWLTHFNLS